MAQPTSIRLTRNSPPAEMHRPAKAWPACEPRSGWSYESRVMTPIPMRSPPATKLNIASCKRKSVHEVTFFCRKMPFFPTQKKLFLPNIFLVGIPREKNKSVFKVLLIAFVKPQILNLVIVIFRIVAPTLTTKRL